MIINKDIKNILISRTDRLGDVVLALPLIDEAKKNFKDAKIFFLAKSYVADLIEDYEGIDEFVSEDSFKDFNEKYSYFKNKNLDLVINVKPRFDLALMFFLLRVKYRIGTAYRWYSFLYNMKVYEHRKDSLKHESEYNLNLLNYFFKGSEPKKVFHFKYFEKEKVDLNKKLNGILDEKYIVIHPGSGGSAKDIPVKKLAEFGKEFLNIYSDYKIVITGVESEKQITGNLFDSINNKFEKRILDTTGKISLKELMILIDNSEIFLANSTGPIHIAGALNKNIIGFYPNDTVMSETRWKPLSDYSVILKPENNSDNMELITVQDIIIASKSFLDK